MANKIENHLLVCVTLILLFGVSMIANAQTVSGTLRGTVTDANGAVIPNATIKVRHKETGLERTVTTLDDGSYHIPFLPIGDYSLESTRTDFNRVIRSNVTVGLNQSTVVNIRLDPAVTGEVTVTDEAAPINTTNAQIAGTLSASQIEERPVLNQGNFLTLAETFTGFQENPTAGQNNPTASSGSSINFNGTGTRGATFQINGVNNDDSSENQNRQGASLATIKAFQVITNNFTAEFGRGYGAVVLVQTKSGTNNVNGEAYWYHNDSALNARAYYSHLAKPVNRRNQYGGVVGFPIFRDKLFGFVSFDRTQSSGAGGYTRDLFLPAELNEANWFQTTPANDTPSNRAFIKSYFARFSGLTPNTTLGPRVFQASRGFSFPDEDYSGRFDWNVGSNDTVFTRYQYSRQKRSSEDIIPGEATFQNHKQQNVGLSWTHIFSPTIVGEFRYGLGLRTTLVNILAGNDTPIIRFTIPAAAGQVTVGSAGNFPIQRYQTDHQLVYNVSSVWGANHYVKAGIDHRFQRLDDLADNNSRGSWSWNTSICGGVTYTSTINAFLNGCVPTFSRGYADFFLENRIGETNLYVEDNWKIRSNLTLNLGMRYEFVKAPREVNDRIDYVFANDGDNFEPRLGVAFSPSAGSGILGMLFGSEGSSSIRGGYGIYHGRLFQSIFSQTGLSVRFNPPRACTFTQLTVGFVSNNIADPTGGFVCPGTEPTTRYSKNLVIDPELEMPYTHQWNVSFERQLPWESAIRISYVGNRGMGLAKYRFGNAPSIDPEGVLVQDHPNNSPLVLYTAANRPAGDPRAFDTRGQTLQRAANFLCAGTGLANIPITTACPTAVPLGNLEYSLRVTRANERRPDARFAGHSEVFNGAFSYYDAMQLEYSKRLSNNLNFQAAYTWSKALDTTSEATFVGAGDSNQNGNDSKASKSHSRFHTPHRFTLFGTYRLPWFAKDKGILGQVLGGWQATMVFKWAHGTPFTVTGTSADFNGDNVGERPAILDPSILGRSVRSPEDTPLPASAFRIATFADVGCCIVGRNTFYIDGVKNVDLAFSKKFPMPWGETHSLLVRADLFNAFNLVQFGFPTTAVDSASFGRVSASPGGLATQYAPRNIQVSLKYSF